MAFDYKKGYKEFYLPPKTPGIVTVPAMNFLAVRGRGDPNEEGGTYKQALELLYAVAYTIKMSKMGKHKLEGYFDYVVPPLEGLWWQEDTKGVDYSRKVDVMGHTKRNWGTLKEAVLSAIKRYLNRNNWTQNGISMHSGPPHS